MKEFTVKRSKWLRGDPNSYLLRPSDKKMCCLGFCALMLGCTEKDIFNQSNPEMYDGSKFPSNFFNFSGDLSPIVHKIITINDEEFHTSDEEREENLKKLFLKLDIIINFED